MFVDGCPFISTLALYFQIIRNSFYHNSKIITSFLTALFIILFIPQATVDNNLGPDFADNQHFYSTTFVCKYGLCMFLSCRASDKSAVGTTFKVFSYDADWAKNRTHYLRVDVLRVTLQSWVLILS